MENKNYFEKTISEETANFLIRGIRRIKNLAIENISKSVVDGASNNYQVSFHYQGATYRITSEYGDFRLYGRNSEGKDEFFCSAFSADELLSTITEKGEAGLTFSADLNFDDLDFENLFADLDDDLEELDSKSETSKKEVVENKEIKIPALNSGAFSIAGERNERHIRTADVYCVRERNHRGGYKYRRVTEEDDIILLRETVNKDGKPTSVKKYFLKLQNGNLVPVVLCLAISYNPNSDHVVYQERIEGTRPTIIQEPFEYKEKKKS